MYFSSLFPYDFEYFYKTQLPLSVCFTPTHHCHTRNDNVSLALHPISNKLSCEGKQYPRTGYHRHKVLLDPLAILTVSGVLAVEIFPVSIKFPISKSLAPVKR